MALLHLVEKMDLTVEEVDKFTGPALGRPKSATFRTTDVVGLDTMIKVANGLYDNCPQDKAHDLFKLPAYVQKMAENNWLGDKTKQGFYKKIKGADGQSEILALDLKTLEYRPQQKVKSAYTGFNQIYRKCERPHEGFCCGKRQGRRIVQGFFFWLV